MRYPVILYPDPILKRATQKVEVITDDLLELLDDLYETMIAHDGVGIAAPQVGKAISVAVVSLEEDQIFEMINPKIIEKSSNTALDVEGCLSIPDTYGTVERPQEIVVRYVNREGYEVELEAYGYLARAIQHEIDHLNGELFIDKIVERIPKERLLEWMEEQEDE